MVEKSIYLFQTVNRRLELSAFQADSQAEKVYLLKLKSGSQFASIPIHSSALVALGQAIKELVNSPERKIL